MSKKKSGGQYKNKRENLNKAKKVRPAPQAAVLTKEQQEAEDAAFREKYGKGGVIRNTLRIWRDSSPLTFISYFPVLLMQLIYAALWFLSSVLAFIPATQNAGVFGREAATMINIIMAAFGLPAVMTILHLRYNMRKEKKYFFNTFIYTLPACLIYVGLNLLYMYITVMFQENKAESVAGILNTSLYVLLAMLSTLTVFSCIAQIVLMTRRRRSDDLPRSLGLKLNKK